MKIKQEISYILFIVAISISVFSLAYPSPKVYMILAESIWGWILLNYGSKYNKKLLARVLEICLGNGISYMSILKIKQVFPEKIEDFEWILLGIYLLCGLLTLYYIIKKPDKLWKSSEENLELYSARRYDLERILAKLQEASIVGINAGWGDGKSFLTDRLLKRESIREDYEVIRMDLLVCNLDRIESILLEELNQLLQKHRIYTFSSQHLQKLLQVAPNTSWLSEIYPVKSSISGAFRELKDALSHIPCKILIVYEDIDRIQDRTVLKNIFAISEKLADSQIHILYQYDEQNLEDVGFTREFLEKYIPYVVNLTEMTYQEMVRLQWKEIQMPDTVSLDRILKLPNQPIYDYNLKKILNIEFSGFVSFRNLTIRKVKLFLNEVKQFIQENQEYEKEESMGLLICGLFIKNFFYRYFKKLEFGRSFCETLLFQVNGQMYSLQELIQFCVPNKEDLKPKLTQEQIQKAFEESNENKEKLCVLLFLGYRTTKYFEKKEIYKDESRKDADFRIMEKNEKIDRILWNISSNGKSEYTNLENAIKEFQNKVLDAPLDWRQEKWRTYKESMYYQNLRKDNGTIFLFGEPHFVALFRGYYILNEPVREWKKLIEFYFSQKENKTITLNMLEALNYVLLEDKELFLLIISKLKTCKISGNMNYNTLFLKFLKNFIKPIYYFGYLGDYDYERLVISDLSSGNLEETLKNIKEELEEIEGKHNPWGLEEIQQEVKIIVGFLEYLLQMVNMENVYKQPPFFKTSISSKWRHQEEMDRLKVIGQQDEERYQKELEKSYHQGKLVPVEVAALRKMLEEKKE